MWCQYADALGVPGRGIHFHVFGVAIVDVVATVIGAAVLAQWWQVDFTIVLAWLFASGILLHRLFCVDTTVDRLLKRLNI